MTSLDELEGLFTPVSADAVMERPPRKHRRHVWERAWLKNEPTSTAWDGHARVTKEMQWPDDIPVMACFGHGVPVLRDPLRARRGRNNRARGNAIEREVAAKLGLRRTGQYGGPDDAAGEWLVVQVKSGGSFPERIWRWLQALPSNAAQTRAVVVTDAPGPGHRRRSLVIVDLEDWAALHGDSPVAVRERWIHPQDGGYPAEEVQAQWPVDHLEGKE